MIDVTTLHKIAIRIGEKTYTGYFSPNIIPKESLTNGLFGFGIADSANGYYRLTTAPGTFGTFLTKENILSERSSIDIDDYNTIDPADNNMVKKLRQIVKANKFSFTIYPIAIVFPETKDFKRQICLFDKYCDSVQEFSDRLDDYLNLKSTDEIAIELFRRRKTPIALKDALEEVQRRTTELNMFSDILSNSSAIKTIIKKLK